MIGDLFEALLKGAPLVGLASYGLYYRLLGHGYISGEGTLKEVSEEARGKIKEMKKDKSTRKVERSFMRFGGGYYGVIAIITFVIIELRDAIGFFGNWEKVKQFFSNFGINTFVDFLVNQVQNFIQAAIWFAYWPSYIDGSSLLVWLGVTYAAYYGGMHLAREHVKNKKLYKKS